MQCMRKKNIAQTQQPDVVFESGQPRAESETKTIRLLKHENENTRNKNARSVAHPSLDYVKRLVKQIEDKNERKCGSLI